MKPLRDAIVAALVLFLSSSACIWVIGWQAREAHLDLARGDLLRQASAAAGLVDGDRHKLLTRDDQAESPLYRELIGPLVAMHRRVPEIAYLFTFVERGGKLFFILDTATQEDRLGFHREMKASRVMDPYESESPEEDAKIVTAIRNGNSYVATNLVRDNFGIFLTGVAPVFDSQGHPVAGVGVNLDVTELSNRLDRGRLATWSGLAVAGGVAALMGFIVWNIRRRTLLAEDERVGAMEARSRAEVGQALLVEALGEIVYHADLVKDSIAYSGRCEALLGRRPGEMHETLDGWLDDVHPDDLARVEEAFRGSRDERLIYSIEYRVRRADGEYTWVSDRAIFTYDESGAAVAMDGVMLDINSRRVSDERFRVLFEESTEPHMLVDAAGVLDCNRATVEMLGYDDKLDIIREPLTKFWPEFQPDGRSTLEHASEIRAETLEHGIYRCEVLKKHASGELIPVDVSTTYVTIAGKKLMLVIWHDLRPIKRAQRELELSESKYRELVEGLDLIVFQTDVGGHLLFLNPAWERMAGYAVAESLGDHFVRFVFSEDHSDVIEKHRRKISGAVEVESLAFRIRCKDGTALWLEGYCRVKRDASGEIVGTTGTLADVTARRQADRELIAAKESAEIANRTKSEFLAVMSHEIRTPLNGVLGFSSLLMHTRLDDTQQEYLRTIASCGDALLAIIDDILDFSRMESGRIELESQAFDLCECVEHVLDMHAARAYSRGLELVSEFAKEMPTAVIGDPGRLGQVLSNLVGNAVKFTQTGEIVVDCRLAWAEPTCVTAEFIVSDTGIGIERQKLEHLFEPFVQADSSMSRRYGGAGLGLAICRRLVRAMDGRISVASEPGIGTKFTFRVRLKRDLAAQPPPFVDLRQRRILIAESNDVLRAALERVLEQCEAEAVGCGDMAEVLAASDCEKPIDLLVVDTNFSGDATAVAELAADRNVPIVALVPLGIPVSEIPRSLPNEWRRLPKPIHASALIAALGSMLSGNAPAHEEDKPEGGGGGDIPSAQDTRILIVEDNVVNQKLLKRMLANMGFEAHVASGGLECMDACGEARFTLIFMDIQMPGMDGFEATKQLRERGDPAWIVALTAHVMAEDRDRCMEAGMDDFLAKPVRLEALRGALQRYSERRGRGEA